MSTRKVGGLFAALAMTALLVSGGAPANAVSAGDFATLQAAFAAPDTVAGSVELDDDIDGLGGALELAADGELALDLAGYDLTGVSIALGAGSTLTIDDTGDGGTLVAAGQFNQAGIRTTGASLEIAGGSITATGGNGAAGIGGVGGLGEFPSGSTGTVLISGGTVVAGGGAGGAGIGTGAFLKSASDGSVTITGGNVTARGNDGGAGIGGGAQSAAPPVRIDDGVVDAAALSNGIGIGSAGGVLITGGTVTATSNGYRPAIGSVMEAVGASLTVEGGSVVAMSAAGPGIEGQGDVVVSVTGGVLEVTAGGGTAIGFSTGENSALRVGDDGLLRIAANTELYLPATQEVTAIIAAGGTIELDQSARLSLAHHAKLSGGGELRGSGTIQNFGAIVLPVENVDWEQFTWTSNSFHFLVVFHDETSPDPPVQIRVFAPTFQAAERSLPGVSTQGRPFLGWWVRNWDHYLVETTELAPLPRDADGNIPVFARYATVAIEKTGPAVFASDNPWEADYWMIVDAGQRAPDPDDPGIPTVRSGSPVTWAYKVTAYDGPLQGLVVTDVDAAGNTIAVSCPTNSLNAGDSMYCRATAVVRPTGGGGP